MDNCNEDYLPEKSATQETGQPIFAATSMIRKNPLPTIVFTAFLDMLGMGIIIPILPALFISHDHSILDADTSERSRDILYGFLAAAFPIAQFFGAPVLGALSDKYGRKSILRYAVAGGLIGYLMLAAAVYLHSVVLLFVGRMIAGAAGGNIPIIFSSIADISDPHSRTRRFGLVGMSFGLGFIVGPAVGGYAAHFGTAAPFLVGAMLSVVNLFMVQFIFPETLHHPQQREISLAAGFRNVKKAFSNPSLRPIFFTSFSWMFGFTFLMQFLQVYLYDKFKLSPPQIGQFFAAVGLVLVLTQGLLVRYLSRKVAPANVIIFSLPGLSAALLLILLPQTVPLFYLAMPFVPIFQGLTMPNMTALVSMQADRSIQGEILGLNTSVQSFALSIPPLIGGYAAYQDSRLPMVMGSFCVFVAWMIFIFLFWRKLRSGVTSASAEIPGQ